MALYLYLSVVVGVDSDDATVVVTVVNALREADDEKGTHLKIESPS